jgi:hypothetical protein
MTTKEGDHLSEEGELSQAALEILQWGVDGQWGNDRYDRVLAELVHHGLIKSRLAFGKPIFQALTPKGEALRKLMTQ